MGERVSGREGEWEGRGGGEEGKRGEGGKVGDDDEEMGRRGGWREEVRRGEEKKG